MLSFDHFFDNQVIARTTQREIDFSLCLENPSLGEEQSEFIRKYFNLDPKTMFSIKQVHGSEIIVLKAAESLPQNYPEADGMITDREDFFLAIRTADCVPVFLFDPKRKCCGLVHAGWRSSHEEILVKTVRLLKEEFGSREEDIRAVLGPSIQECCYQVGEEFLNYFPEDVIQKEKLYFSLEHVNQRQLLSSGILHENILNTRQCTCCDEEFFSYRREGKQAGRMMSLIMIKKGN